MTTTLAGVSTRSPDRLVAIGSLAVRPALYRGANGSVFPVSAQPIHGLTVALAQGLSGSRSRPRKALFHPSTNLHGFVDLPPGPKLIAVTDPENRFLPRTLAATVPDFTALAEALAQGAKTPPAASPPALVTALLRPSPSGPLRDSFASFHGVAREPDGTPIAWAWIQVSTPQGSYTTYSDGRGEYLAILPFLHPIVTVVLDVGDPETDGDDVNDVADTFNADVRAHRLLASVPPSGDPLAVLPPDFDELVPGAPAFDSVYETTAFFHATVPIRVEARQRLDLLSV